MQRRNARRSTQACRISAVALAAIAAVPSILSPHLAKAATFTWDNNTSATHPQDGAGSWDNTLPNFWNGAPAVWNNANNDTAVFGAGGTGGAIGVATGITIGGLQINATGYTFTGGSFVTNGPTVIGLSAGTTSIATPITGTGPVTFNFGSTATGTITSANTYSGSTTFTGGGTLAINSSTVFSGTGGPLVLGGISLVDTQNPGNLANPIVVADSTTNAIYLPNNGTFTGVISGSGTVDFLSGGKVYSFNESSANSNTFTGTIALGVVSTNIRFTSLNAGFGGARIDLGTGAGSIQNRTNTGTIGIGALFGGPSTIVAGDFNSSTDGLVTYEIGGAGVDSVFNGTIADGNATTKNTGISKIGNNNLTLNGTGTYTGPTTVNGGTIVIGNALAMNKSPSVFVNNAGSGALNVTALGAGGYTIPAGQSLRGDGGTVYGNVNVTNATGVVAPGTGSTALSSGALTFANNLTLNGGTILLDVNSSAHDLINVNGALTLTSGSIFITPNANTASNLPVITYPANSPHGSLSNLTVAFGGRVQTGSGLTDNPTTGQISLTITGFSPALNLTWNSTSSANWDVQTSPNWASVNTATDKFFAADSVSFTDGTGLQTTVTKVGLLQPGGFSVSSNSPNDYTINGTGSISGVALSKVSGNSILTLSTGNDLTGASIGAGTVILGASNAISSSATATISLGNGTVIAGGNTTIANNINIFRDNAAIGVNSGNGTFSGIINDQNTADHPGQPNLGTTNVVIASGANLAFTPTALASNFTGTLNFGASNGTVRFVSTTAVSTQGKFDLGTGSLTLNNRDGTGAIGIGALAGGPNTTVQGAVTGNLPSVITIGAANVDSIFNGRIINGSAGTSATVSITKIGSGTLTLNGTSTYSGPTTISAGTLQFNGLYNGIGPFTVSSNLAGTGNINSQVNLTGGTIAPASDNIGSLTVASLAVSSGNLNIQVGGGNADSIVVTAPNGLTTPGTANINISESGATFGRYMLVDYVGTPLANLSGFTPTSFTVNGVNSTLVNNTLNTSVDLYVKNPAEVDSQWVVNGAGQWDTNADWTNSTPPNGLDNVASFGIVLSSGIGTVTLTGPQTVAMVNFDSAGSYLLKGNTLTLDASGGYVGVNVFSGNQTIGSDVVLGKNAVFAVAGSSSLTLGGHVSGAVSILKSGAGVLNLSGNNTYSGPTTISEGTLGAASSGALGDASSTNTLVFLGGALRATGDINSPATRNVQLNAQPVTIDTQGNTVTLGGVVSGFAPLTKVGAGNLVLAGSNTHTGLTTITAGAVTLGASNVFADAAPVAVNGATAVLDLGADHTDTVGGVLLDGGATITGTGASILSLGSGSYDLRSGTVNIPLNGAAALNKTTAGVVTLTASAGYTGATNVTAGQLVAKELGGGTLTITGGSAQITQKASANDISGTSVVPALAISAGASLDVTNNDLIINYTGAVGTQVTDVRSHLLAGRLVTTSTAGGFAVGYADGSVLGRTTFGGVAVDSTSILIGFVYNGDANMDGTVNALDFNAVASNFGLSTNSVWTSGDFTYDGVVDTSDFTALSQNFNKTIAAPGPSLGALVPEPASLAGLAMLGLLARRRRRD